LGIESGQAGKRGHGVQAVGSETAIVSNRAFHTAWQWC
jgi:hypothetical protein